MVNRKVSVKIMGVIGVSIIINNAQINALQLELMIPSNQTAEAYTVFETPLSPIYTEIMNTLNR